MKGFLGLSKYTYSAGTETETSRNNTDGFENKKIKIKDIRLILWRIYFCPYSIGLFVFYLYKKGK